MTGESQEINFDRDISQVRHNWYFYTTNTISQMRGILKLTYANNFLFIFFYHMLHAYTNAGRDFFLEGRICKNYNNDK